MAEKRHTDKDKEKDGNGEVVAKSPITAAEAKPSCGVIMPISECDGLPANHWSEVRDILFEAIESAGFQPNLVSDGDEITVIHKRIIQNIYEAPIVVCDVSGRNANVMFELGMRLTFDKATVIVKDNKTTRPFDTGNVQDIEYPRDLRHAAIEAFMKDLVKKLKATYEASKKEDYSTFLRSFGPYKRATLETTEVSRDQLLLDQMAEMQKTVRELVVGSRVREDPVIVNNPLTRFHLLNKISEKLEALIEEGRSPAIPAMARPDFVEAIAASLSKNPHITDSTLERAILNFTVRRDLGLP